MSKEYFQEIAPEWDKLQESFFNDNIRNKAFKLANIREDELAADIGAGSGYLTEGLLSRGLNVIAIDQSENMIEELSEKFRLKKTKKYKLTCKVGKGENLPVGDNEVDYTFANMYLHHVEEPLLAIKEMTRITKSKGLVVITDLDSHDFNFLEAEHYDRWKGFERDDLKKWYKEAGLTNIQVIPTEETCSSTSTSGKSAVVSVFVAIGEKP